MIPTFIGVTLRNLASGDLGGRVAASWVTRGLIAWAAPLVLAGYLLVMTLVLVRFWDYWLSLV